MEQLREKIKDIILYMWVFTPIVLLLSMISIMYYSNHETRLYIVEIRQIQRLINEAKVKNNKTEIANLERDVERLNKWLENQKWHNKQWYGFLISDKTMFLNPIEK